MSKNIPEIRINGFDKDWKQCKLGKLCSITTGKLDANAMVEDGDYDFYTSGIEKYRIDIAAFEGPAITIAGNGASVGYMHLADGKFNAYQRTYVLRDFLADRQFLSSVIGQELPLKIQEEIRGSGIPYIIMDMLTELNIPLPNKEEQYKVGTFFSDLDNLITLHQQEYDKLVNNKKAMLEKMFPKEGCDVPEIRFKGFDKSWELRELGDVFKEYSEKNHAELPPLTIVQGGGTVRRDESDRNLMYDKNNLSNYKMVNKGDFIVHLRSFEGGLEIATNTGIISPAYHTFHGENTDSRFYYSYFRSQKFINIDLKPHVYGIRDGRSIDMEGMKTIKIPYTSFEEQKAIGDFIDLINECILLQKQELEKLKNIKAALLEKMFV